MSPNLPASVHQRLLIHARATERPFNEVLQRFALERFLYRVGHSPYARRFVLKGAMMLTAWRVPFARPTRDIYLLGHMENSVEQRNPGRSRSSGKRFVAGYSERLRLPLSEKWCRSSPPSWLL